MSLLGSSYDDITCELPSCDLVRKSRLHSERCGSKDPPGWPLLITGTPRSGTVYAQSSLNKHGMQIQDDWHEIMRDGRVSWIFAFEDPHSFGKAKSHGKQYSHVLHQLKEPLSSITSMCSEPFFRQPMADFIRRHIPLNSSYEENRQTSPVCLEFWVQWHTFLTEMKLPTFKIEDVEFHDIFQISGLGHLYLDEPLNASTNSNHRGHRPSFTWQELYTIDPINAVKAWELAHYYGYSYPDIDFDNLTCLDYYPLCNHKSRAKAKEKAKCPSGTHPTNASKTMSPPAANLGFKGWMDGGCVEFKVQGIVNSTYIGLRGLLGEDDLRKLRERQSERFDILFDDVDEEIFKKLNATKVTKRLLSNSTVSDTAPSLSEHQVLLETRNPGSSTKFASGIILVVGAAIPISFSHHKRLFLMSLGLYFSVLIALRTIY